jgi:multidrug efflux pump subunit AcrA (membrane-fusion protein)
MIIRTGFASVQVDSLDVAIAAVQRIATSLGGWVGNTSLSAGANEVRSATIELKIPAARYDEALAGLRPIGKVETVNSNAEDVGEEFVDLTARTTNARRLEERLVTLLATRTGKLEDVLNVERELARVREEIERHEGRLRYLRSRIATSTLTVTVHERAPLVNPSPGESILGEAFRDAWRNFVRFVAAFIASLGTIIPVAVLLAAGALAWRRFRPRRPAPAQPSGESR